MIDITEIQRQRAINDRKTYLLNQLYRLGIYKTRLGKNIEVVRLVDLEQIYINEKCRAAKIYGGANVNDGLLREKRLKTH